MSITLGHPSQKKGYTWAPAVVYGETAETGGTSWTRAVRSVSGSITVNAVEGETHGRGGGANFGDARHTVASAALVASDLAGGEDQRPI